MNVLVIDEPPAARRLAANLTSRLPESTVECASPRPGETAEVFAARTSSEVLATWGDGPGVLVVNANMRCEAGRRADCAGLDALEQLMARHALPSVVLSFMRDPVGFSARRRLAADEGGILIRHNTVSYARLPADADSLTNQVRVAARWPPADGERSRSFGAAFHKRRASAIRHKLENLRAALRMLEGVRRLGLLTRVEYTGTVELLKRHNASAASDLEELLSRTESLPWPGRAGPAGPLTKRVLLIDDEAELSAWHAILRPLCRDLDAELDWAVSPSQARGKLSGDIDIVLLDLHYSNFPEPPDPFEVLAEVRETNPLVPIVIFTTEREGRHVRDLGKDAFHYFFKEVDEEVDDGTSLDTRAYAEAFRRVLRTAIDMSLQVMLRGMVRLSLPARAREESRFERAHDLLEAAASAVERPEVAMCLITGAVIESRAAVAHPEKGVAWSHLKNLFEHCEEDWRGLRKALPDVIKAHRNYASHYEEPPNPPPTPLDALVYLLTATQFVSDLGTMFEGCQPVYADDNRGMLVLEVLGRSIQELCSRLARPQTLDAATREKFRAAINFTESELRELTEEKCAAAAEQGCSPFRTANLDREHPRAFDNVLNVWFDGGPAVMPVIDWQGGRNVAPYLLNACRFLLLERVTQMKGRHAN